MSKLFCPIPYLSLSLDYNLNRRICCHDLTAESEAIDNFYNSSNIKSTPLSQKILESFEKGEIPKNCQYCFDREKDNTPSPRQEYIKKFKDFNLDSDLIGYLDITFDNICNIKCRTCRPEYSNQLTKEFKELNIPCDEFIFGKDHHNNYQKLAQKLDDKAFITITGGEPFISPHVKNFIEYLIENNIAKNKSFRFFSNMTKIPNWLDELAGIAHNIELVVSLDAVGDQLNYIRYPSSWNEIKANIQTFKEKSHQYNIVFHTVLSAYNLAYINDLMDELKSFEEFTIWVPSFTNLSHPTHLSPNVLPKNIKEKYIDELLTKLNHISATIVDNSYKLENLSNLAALKNQVLALKNMEYNNLYPQFVLHNKNVDKIRGQDINKSLSRLFEE